MTQVVQLSMGFFVVLATAVVNAELQEIQVGGSIEFYGYYYDDFFENADPTRIPGQSVAGRPIGSVAQDPVGGAILSAIRTFGSGSGSGGNGWVEQRTSLNLRAQFTDDIATFVEIDHIHDWGQDFRSDFITGADTRGASNVSLYQAYLELNSLFERPLRLRLGRQELVLGNEWLVGNNFWSNPLTYLSFDGLRLTYEQDAFALDVFWMKLSERFLDFGDTDTDFYGLYGAYTGLEGWEFNAYWLYIHDGLEINDTTGGPLLEFAERIRGVDDYGATDLHTVGLRVYGEAGAWDVEGEIAYQWGDAAAAGSTFSVGGYGDDSAKYDVWGAQFALGYILPVAWEPRIYIGGEYYGGEDKRDRSLLAYLNPFYQPQASLSFNRLFSTWESDLYLGASALSNVVIGKIGIEAAPTDKIEVGLDFLYFEALETFETPVWGRFGPDRAPRIFPLPFITRESDSYLGSETVLWMLYAYSEDLTFEAGWAHFFTGDGLADGNFVDGNGLVFQGGLGREDGDMVWVGGKLVF